MHFAIQYKYAVAFFSDLSLSIHEPSEITMRKISIGIGSLQNDGVKALRNEIEDQRDYWGLPKRVEEEILFVWGDISVARLL